MSHFFLKVSLIGITLIFIFSCFFIVHADSQVRVAIITGGHSYDKEPFEAMWASMTDVKAEYFDYAGGKCAFFDNDKYKEFDTIIFYNFHQKITKKQQKNFLDMLNSGKKIIVMHHAISAFPEWNEFSKIIGAKYFLEDMEWEGKKYERSKYKHDVKIPVHIADKNHPITQGVEDFEEIDETYSQFYISPEVHVLLTTNHPESASFIGWVNKYNNTEIFFIQLGHGPQNFANEQFRKLMYNAIKWSAGKNN
ncbi:MAG TPA: ThuA domain-containing protein [Candidatus Hydrogenedens sp.]|nr:ThuA domain-containing protein [Candidatus Hydrogenedens sp.]HOK10133.1 ThuA domain-containing protein [Candidatus Hydrogenedens sp.]HOL21149.1 ThuA domain-containing protein [Candidatus Hydrogenedens sp.]HPP58269.1 ThuA domain-containing protein [Candidatus Hydrogenedens sp.]